MLPVSLGVKTTLLLKYKHSSSAEPKGDSHCCRCFCKGVEGPCLSLCARRRAYVQVGAARTIHLYHGKVGCLTCSAACAVVSEAAGVLSQFVRLYRCHPPSGSCHWSFCNGSELTAPSLIASINSSAQGAATQRGFLVTRELY